MRGHSPCELCVLENIYESHKVNDQPPMNLEDGSPPLSNHACRGTFVESVYFRPGGNSTYANEEELRRKSKQSNHVGCLCLLRQGRQRVHHRREGGRGLPRVQHTSCINTSSGRSTMTACICLFTTISVLN